MSRNALLPLTVIPLFAVGLYGVFRPGLTGGESAEVVGDKLNAIPLHIGPWQGRDRNLSETALRGAEASAYLYREYTHETTRESVSILLLYGDPAALGAHTPEVCYSGLGYDASEAPTKLSLPPHESGHPTEFWHGRFARERGRDALELLWGWSANGTWVAAEHPRWTFADHKTIYKLYAQRIIPRGPSTRPPEHSPLTSFLIPFLQEVNPRVFSRAS